MRSTVWSGMTAASGCHAKSARPEIYFLDVTSHLSFETDFNQLVKEEDFDFYPIYNTNGLFANQSARHEQNNQHNDLI